MSSFQSAMCPPDLWNKYNDETKTLLRKIGAIFPDDFCSTGVPQIFLHNLVDKNTELDFSSFRVKIVIGHNSGFNSADISPFPHGPVRLTINRWGYGDDQCGKIIIGNNSELN